MSGVIKVNKSQLETAFSQIKSKVENMNETISNLSSVLKSIPSHSEFSSLTSKAIMISDSINNLYTDFGIVSSNLDTYVSTLTAIDTENIDTLSNQNNKSTNNEISSNLVNTSTAAAATTTLSSRSWTAGTKSNYYSSNSYYSGNNRGSNYTYSYSSTPSGTIVYSNNDNGNKNFESNNMSSSDYNVSAGGKYNYDGIEEYIEDLEGVTIKLPAGLGSVHSYMGWQCITAVSSRQYKLREVAGMVFDEEGFAKIGDRYVVATTTTFGNVGDYIDVYQEDGTIIKCIIGDIKSQGDAGCTKWGHNNGQCVVEFVVDKNSWYGNRMHANPGTVNCHPEWNQNITKIVNKGNYFKLIKTDAARFDEEEKTSSVEVSEV